MSIELILCLFLIIIVVFVFSGRLKNTDNSDSESTKDWESEFPFYSKRPLTKSEQVLYYKLLDALPEYNVLPQVGLSRFLGVKKGYKSGQHNNRINRMSVDYLICTKDFQIIAAIELDDPTHERQDRIVADAKKDKALQSAGIRLIRWKTVPSLDDMRLDVLSNK